MIQLGYIALYIVGFIFAILVLVTHTLGAKLLYCTKPKVPNQRLILMNFSFFSIFSSLMLIIRGIYCFIYGNDEEKTARYYLYTNGIFIGLGLCYTFILFLLTIDRLIATLKPLQYFTHFRGGECYICLALVFGTSSAFALAFTFLSRPIQVFGYLVALAIITLLSLFMLFTYIIIFYKIKRRKLEHSSSRIHDDKNSKRKIIVPFLINLVLIFFHVIPHILVMKYHERFNHYQLASILLLITNLGLFLDAVIYIFLLRNTQRALGRGLGRLEESIKQATTIVKRTSLTCTKNNIAIISRERALIKTLPT